MPADHAGEWGYGDVWTFVAIDADTKLVPSWAVGRRDGSRPPRSFATWPTGSQPACN